jgi:hypothetical protein
MRLRTPRNQAPRKRPSATFLESETRGYFLLLGARLYHARQGRKRRDLQPELRAQPGWQTRPVGKMARWHTPDVIFLVPSSHKGFTEGLFYGGPYHPIPPLEKDQYERIRRLRLTVYHHNLQMWYRVV